MQTNNLLQQLQSVPKTYFSFNDLKKFYPKDTNQLKVIVHRLVKQKRLSRLLRGYYAVDINRVDFEQLVCELVAPSYISLEYALHYYQIIDQVPACITLVTSKKGRKYNLPQPHIEYAHFNSRLFFGYRIQGNILIAEKEKALLDEIYLISLKKRSLSLDSLDLSLINKTLFNKWLNEFPSYTQKLAHEKFDSLTI